MAMLGIFKITIVCLALGADDEEVVTTSPDVDQLLLDWQKATEVASLDVEIAVREMDAEGKWTSDQPRLDRFRFRAQPLEARLDGPTSTVFTREGELVHTAADQETQRESLHANDRHRAKLWLDHFPAFLLVGVEPAKMKHRFEIRAYQAGKNELTVLLYPQTWADEKRVSRIDVHLTKDKSIPAIINVLWRDGHRTFCAMREPKADVALEDELFQVR